jgi:hypothetical protein
MKKRLATIAIASTTIACGMLFSFDSSGQRGVSLAIQSADARVGRPATPASVAGVARRQGRRAAYGAGVVGAGLAAGAVGAATVAAATSPWGYGSYGYAPGYQAYAQPYHEAGYYEAYAADPTLAGGYSGGFYAESPWGDYECRPPHAYGCQPYVQKGWRY